MVARMQYYCLCRSSRFQMFAKMNFLTNFVNVIRKHLRWSLFLIKLQVFRPSFIEGRLQRRFFPVKFAKLLRTPLFYRTRPVAASIYIIYLRLVVNDILLQLTGTYRTLRLFGGMFKLSYTPAA